MLTLVASVPSTVPLAGITGILILWQKRKCLFLKEGRTPRFAMCLLGSRAWPVSAFFPVFAVRKCSESLPRASQQGVEPGSILSGGSTHLGKQSHSSAVILHPWSSSEVFVKEVR